MNRHGFFGLIVLAVLALTHLASCDDEGCNQEEIDVPPEIAILGKWEVIEKGTNTDVDPDGYSEYLPDSIFLFFDYNEQAYLPQKTKYWIVDSLLYHQYIFNDGTFLTSTQWYEFIECDQKLRLIPQMGIAVQMSIQKKID